MATSTDIATIRVQRYLSMPLVQRCHELAMLIDESSTTELQHVFPMIIDSLFGITDNIGWGLHYITYKKNPQEYEILYNFLSPLGPIFSLCYKLLPDCYLKYNFPISYLPSKIRSMLEEGVIPPFYLDKFRDDQGTRVPSALCMNPFEYYIFHFAYHLTNPWLQLQQQENVWANWETVYVQSAHYYLHHFLPRDNSTVLPIIGPYIKKTPQRKLMHMPENKRLQTPRLLRASILSPGSTNLVVGVPQQQCLPQVWRSETVIQVFLDFWMEYTEDDHMPSQMNMSYSTPIPHRHSIHSGEHIRLVRAFIKTLHEFANSSTGDKSAMDELKRIILPSVQGKIYIFLRKAIYHWPLDSSFRLILEAWLSFIQPWRYVPGVTYTKQGRPEEEERGKIHNPNRWIAFVANNLLAYTVIFQQLLPRFMRTDLVAPKNALMLFRVTKVFSQPHLARILSEIESCMDDANLNRSRMQSSQWTSIVRQQIMELEGPTYQYIPMFSVAIITQISFFLSIIKQAHVTATSLIEALEKRKQSQQFLVGIWEFFFGEDNSSDDISIEERRRVPLFLANAQQQLIEIFEISIEDIPQITITPDQEYHESILSTSFHQQYQMDSSLDSSRPGLFVPISDGRTNFRYIEYMGDPELQPVRSNECPFLVRNLYKFCTYINKKYQHEINTLYIKQNFLGNICRQILIPPTTVVQLPKRTMNGFSSGHEELIPPRLSLRRLSNYSFLISIFAMMSIARITNYGVLWLLCIIFFVWSIYILIRAIFEPWFKSSTNTFRPNTTAFSIN
ncbi:PREDICTED: sphingomyelin phosphodiesterase 4 isoform X2 [Polistes canadensis]|uniref:sphingomyelin phosphodiesterase 4 isoform X2 n=1 Tax=Polistes canadensis TaxID=91411 RepID=UPI00071904E0|nr:PREDICTED: sphingomyelin phosphodiesterase 4 isoform X2 [Polistes canadensis]